MRLAPQWRALFQHLHFKKWSEDHTKILASNCASCHGGVQIFDNFSTSELPEVVRRQCVLYILPYKLQMCFAAQSRCHFSTSALGVVRACGVLYILTWKCALRHSGVQFFIFALKSYLRTRRLSEPTFRPSGTMNHWKTQHFPIVLPFCAAVSSFYGLSFFWLYFLLTLLLCSAFQLSILSEVTLLSFLR